MKNNLLCGNVEKCSEAEEKLFTCNDILELIMMNKMQRGELDEFVEDVLAAAGPGWEETGDGKGVADSSESKSLCAGYTDCMEEAIRYLVEVEKIPPEQPVVRNLKAHLEQSKERILDGACRPSAQRECPTRCKVQEKDTFVLSSAELDHDFSFFHSGFHWTNCDPARLLHHLVPL